MDYFYLPFWVLLFTIVGIAGVTIKFLKLNFIDIQVIIMIAALGFAADMLLCKQFDQYYFVFQEFRGWYSFWACLFMNPALGYIYIKFLPKQKGFLPFYIGIWTTALALVEIYIAKPYGIVHYPGWKIIPWSLILYTLTFVWEYIYYNWLKKAFVNKHTYSH